MQANLVDIFVRLTPLPVRVRMHLHVLGGYIDGPVKC